MILINFIDQLLYFLRLCILCFFVTYTRRFEITIDLSKIDLFSFTPVSHLGDMVAKLLKALFFKKKITKFSA